MVDTKWLVGRPRVHVCMKVGWGEGRENVVQNGKNERGQPEAALDFDIQVLFFKDYVACSCLGNVSNLIGYELIDEKSVWTGFGLWWWMRTAQTLPEGLGVVWTSETEFAHVLKGQVLTGPEGCGQTSQNPNNTSKINIFPLGTKMVFLRVN